MPKQPSILSIQLADTAAIGHVNIGLELYRRFEELPNKQPLDANRTIELGVPAVTNLALGLELLLKVHHFQLTGNYPFGHDIQKLGSSFSQDTLEILRTNYKSLHSNPNISQGLEFRYSGGPPGFEAREWQSVDFSTYDLAIAYIGPMYVKWRYIFEEFEDTIDIRVSFAPLYFTAMSVHKAIRDNKGNMHVTMACGPPAS